MSASAAQALLSIETVGKRFGGVIAVDRVSFHVDGKTVVGLIGPNGSGKTTLLNIVNGVLAPDQGDVILGGTMIGGRRPSDLAAMGLSRTFQTSHCCTSISWSAPKRASVRRSSLLLSDSSVTPVISRANFPGVSSGCLNSPAHW
jgi:ABC-type branched-subunit amino acid transport system ATPase component